MMNEEVEVSGSFRNVAHNYSNQALPLFFLLFFTAGSTTASETAESSIEGSSDAAIATSEVRTSDSEDVQLEPTKSEMERERLMSKAEQVHTIPNNSPSEPVGSSV